MPTSYGANQYVNELYNIRATIDGLELPFITGISIKHKVNSARVVTVSLANREALEMLRVGAEVTINFGLSDAYANKVIKYEEGTSLGLVGSPNPNDFYGRIGTCVLENVTTNYTPGDKVRSFADGAPTQITMALTFRETELLTKEKINQGY